MRVLLAEPPQLFLDGSGQTRQVHPLGLGYVGAALAVEHDVRLLLPDTRSYTGIDPWGEIARAIIDEAPDVVGIAAVTANSASAAVLASLVKSIDPDACVVLGGVHASTEPEAALNGAPGVDFVVQGEGEETMLELVREIAARGVPGVRTVPPRAVAGLYWRDVEGEICSSAPRPPIADLDRVPFPLRDGLVWSDDVHPAFYQGIVTMRGCPFRCIYCAVPSSNTRRARYRSAVNVVDEIDVLRERYGVSNLFFHDSVFTMHRSRTVEICDTMIDRGLAIPFHCQTRADRVDGELLVRLKEAGCEQIFFGIESGDRDSLLRIGKKMSLDTIRDAVRMVKDLDIRCTGFFMIGFPWETEVEMNRTADFATSIGLDAVSLFSATPLPGTELFEMTGGCPIPDSVDFRTPQVNLTVLPDHHYALIFSAIKTRFDSYNQAQMTKRLARLERPTPVGWVES
jgi:anaerobic magnesium-protoporphyrin IX monomethyl ester cyclase